jgi:DNA modification methylase
MSRRVATSTTPPTETATWRNRITGSGEEAPDQLLANPANWRLHPKAQQDALAGALDQVGWVQQVLVNRRSGFVVDGHARVALALTRGEPTVPVLYVDLEPDEEALVLATLDPIGAMATADDEKLRALLADITVDDAGLLALLGELAGNDPKAGLTDPDDVPEPPEEPYVKAGELWLLGDHRLLCGDSTSAHDVARLLGGAEPRLLVTDPPYGVSLDQSWRDGVYNGPHKRVRGWGVKQGAERPYMMRDGASGQPERENATAATAGAHRRTVGHRNTSISGDVRADWSEAFALVPSIQVGYVWYASAHTLQVLTGLLGIGFELAQQIIWDKGLFSIGRQWYHWAHEPCFVVRKPGAKVPFYGERNQATIWRAPSPKRLGAGSTEEKTDHPTQKPAILSEIPIANHLRPGEAVYEPFSGSGTTIIAAERLGRRCYAMEIDPRYVQVAIERWQSFTGREAARG